MEVREGFNRLITTGAPPMKPRYCADIDGENNSDFGGFSLQCIFRRNECPDGMRCALTNAC